MNIYDYRKAKILCDNFINKLDQYRGFIYDKDDGNRYIIKTWIKDTLVTITSLKALKRLIKELQLE